MEISVIIPVYNVEKYLPKCLDSVCMQDDCVKEIILINDGSTDRSLEICKAYVQRDKRIKLIDQENKGLSATVRIGVRAATCKYIGFVDSDDYIESNMFRLMAEKIIETDADIVFCDYDTVYENQTQKQENINVEVKAEIYEKHNGSFNLALLPSLEDFTNISGSRCNKVMKRELLLNNIGFIDHGIRVGEDIALTIPVLFAAQRVTYIKSNLYHYFQRSTSIVYTYTKGNLNDWIKIINVLSLALNLYEYNLYDFDSNKLALLYSVCFSKIRKSNMTFRERRKEFKRIYEDKNVQDIIATKKFTCNSKYLFLFKLLKLRWFALLALLIKIG